MTLLIRPDFKNAFSPSRLDWMHLPEMSCLKVRDGVHTRSGSQYYIICKICRAENILAGETGSNTVHKLTKHKAAIVNKNTGNAMAKHLAIYHKENVGGLDSFKYTSVATFKKNLDISEAVSVSLKYFYQDISEE